MQHKLASIVRVLGISAALAAGPLVPSAYAWNATGHMAVAAIAYDNLTPGARSKVDGLLAQHRDHQNWIDSMPQSYTDQRRFSFMKAATWPDDIRKTPDDRPTWHYIDVPVIAPGYVPDAGSTVIPTPNAETQIVAETKILADKKASGLDKSVALCWVEHLIGDIHQPLHDSALFSADFPTGDKGGNTETLAVDAVASDPLESAAQPHKLHAFWDDLFGATKDPAEVDQIASRLELISVNRKEARVFRSHSTVHSWIMEGNALAVSQVYLNGKLSISAVPGSATYVVALPEGYIQTAHTVADRQALLAGLRLAQTLNNALAK